MKIITTQFLQICILLIFCCCLVNTAAAAPTTTEVYKWTDKEGNVHYAARPGDKSAVKMNKLSKRFSPIEDKNIKANQEREKREKMCQEAKTKKTKYESAPFLFREDKETKKQIRLSEQENKDALLRVDKDISYWCNPAPKTTPDAQ